MAMCGDGATDTGSRHPAGNDLALVSTSGRKGGGDRQNGRQADR